MLTHFCVWVMLAIAMAFCGDFSGLKVVGTVFLYGIVIFAFLWFLAVTGWAGIIIIILISLVVAGFSSMKD